MSISKNFVVRHGFESSTDLILADADTRRVGVGTTAPEYTLHVNGGIGVTDAYVSGIGTFADELNVGLGGTVLTVLGIGNSIGVGTALPAFLLDIRSPVSTGQTALYVQGDIEVTGDIRADDISITNLNVSGISTFVGFSTFNDYVFIQDGLNVIGAGATLTSLNVSGVSTFGDYVDINNSVDIGVDLNVVGLSTLGGYVDINNSVDISGNLNVTGVSTFGDYVDINNSVDISNDLNVVGLSTLGGYVDINNSVDISGNLNVVGIATIATANIVDATLLSLIVSGIATLGNVNISDDLNVTGVTTLGGYVDINNFVDISGNLNVVGIATITNITGPDGTITNINSTNANLTNIFSTDLSVTGVSTLGTVQISSGIITATSGIVTYYGDGTYLTGTASLPNLQSVLNTGNTSTIGMSISGVITATSFVGDGSGLTGAGSTVFNDTTTNQEFFPLFTDITTGTITASGISTSKLTYNPANGEMTAINFNSTSDVNLKTNIYTVENALETVNSLRGVSFDWKETGKGSYGVIAQEIEEVLPELVKNGEIKSVNYNGLIGVLIEAVKELSAEVRKIKSYK